jgi:hypothetical protein
MRNLLLALAVGLPSLAVAQTPASSPQIARFHIAAIDMVNIPTTAISLNLLDSATALFTPRFSQVDSAEAIVGDIRRSVAVLRRQWNQLDPSRRTAATNPIEFRAGLAYDLAVLRAASSESSPTIVRSVLRETADDLAEKAEHCVKSPSGMASLVEVNVRTWAGKTESTGWQVFYMPKIMEFAADQDAATMPFKKFSSPAVEALPPGRYLIWARQPGPNGASSERTILRVGGGVATLDQDIAVPPPT